MSCGFRARSATTAGRTRQLTMANHGSTRDAPPHSRARGLLGGRSMKLKLSVIALLAFTASAGAEDRVPGTPLGGRVTDTTTGEAVAGAQVFVSGPPGLLS